MTHFKNKGTIDEMTLEEQSGIARQFNAKMFDSLKESTMAELENVVYYRGEISPGGKVFARAPVYSRYRVTTEVHRVVYI